MSAIPEDITDAARKVTRSWQGMDDLEGKIAIALASERRRCALLARQWTPSSFESEHYAANSIADQIMAGGK